MCVKAWPHLKEQRGTVLKERYICSRVNKNEVTEVIRE